MDLAQIIDPQPGYISERGKMANLLVRQLVEMGQEVTPKSAQQMLVLRLYQILLLVGKVRIQFSFGKNLPRVGKLEERTIGKIKFSTQIMDDTDTGDFYVIMFGNAKTPFF